MQFLSFFAVFFVVWWLTLFIVLPIGMRTQQEAGQVVNGTVASAPAKFRGLRVMLLTTVIALVICGAWLGISYYFNVTLDDLPRVVPDFGH
jgi:predicted secreted protein